MTYYYYYDPVTGLFKKRSNKIDPFTDLPYVENLKGWRYDQHRVNVDTGEIEAI